MKHLLIAVTLVLLAGFVGPPVNAVDCPPEFSTCVNVPGKKCVLGTGVQCNIMDLGVRECTRSDESTFSCQNGQMIGKKSCPCTTKLQNTCCPEENCSFGPCGSCETQPGSQELVCLYTPCEGPCITHYCTGEGTGCQWSNICLEGGCCQYTCGVSIAGCTGIDPVPDNACP